MTLQDRIDNYVGETRYPESLFVGSDNRIVGSWFMGNNYTVKSEYHGGYPHSYLQRVKALYPDKTRALHLCSGKVDLSIFPGDTVDINPALNPTYVDNAETCEKVPLEKYDIIMLDRPYTGEDAQKYGTSTVNLNKVMKTVGARASVDTVVVMLDQVLPMYRKAEFFIDGTIAMIKSTNHRFRVVVLFRKIKTESNGA